ncbi:hypothetical protein CL684_01645 [Candidatus Campbellbacteria bacterium]|nr:hypothetical protein [Candidatus Campbellbacteria bacterium]|tara:strand:- start:808 stop:1539 length:732 start_codon:yes stop_codon:yes gene_type:complete
MTTIQKITGILAGSAMALALVFSPGTAKEANAQQTVQIPVSTLQTLISVLQDLNNQAMMTEPMAKTPASDLRVSLNKTLQEHASLGLEALYDVIDDENSTADAVEALDENTVELSAAVGSVFGDDAEDAFKEIWRDHIGFFADYATGLRENDDDMMDDAMDDIEDYQDDISDFFSGALPDVDKATVVAGAGEHAELFFESMDAWEDQDYEEAYELQREAQKQIQGIADLLSINIVKENPSMFR